MEDHIYEDPDAMPTVPGITLVASRDYRENFAASSGSEVTGKQQFIKENSTLTKSTKKWNINLKARKNKQSGDTDKPTKREKKVSGENQGSAGGKSLKKANFESDRSSLTEHSGQSLVKGRSKGHSLQDPTSPALLGPIIATMKVVPDYDSPPYEPDSPPPLLPSRGYLLDDDFAIELNAIEKQVNDSGTDTEPDEDSDGYTAMDTVNVPPAQYAFAMSEQENESHKSQRRYENFADTNKELHPEGAHYYNFADATHSPSREIAPAEQKGSRTLSVPARTGKKGSPTRTMLAAEQYPIPPRGILSEQGLSEPIPPRGILSEQGLSEQKNTPPIPERSFKKGSRGHLTRTVPGAEHIPPVPKGRSNLNETQVSESHPDPMIPKRPEKRGQEAKLVIPLPPRTYITESQSKHGENDEEFYDDVVSARSPVYSRALSDQGDTPKIPERSYGSNTREENFARKMTEMERNVPQVPERDFTNVRYVTTAQEQGDESHTPQIPARRYEDFTDIQNTASQLQEKESDSYAPPIPSRRYDNGSDDDAYINQDDTPDEYVNQNNTPYGGRSRQSGYMNSERENSRDQSEEDLAYDYVVSDAIRSIRRRAPGRK